MHIPQFPDGAYHSHVLSISTPFITFILFPDGKYSHLSTSHVGHCWEFDFQKNMLIETDSQGERLVVAWWMGPKEGKDPSHCRTVAS